MRQLAVGGAVASVVGGLLGLIVLGWEGLYILLVMIVCAGGFLFALHLTESILATDKVRRRWPRHHLAFFAVYVARCPPSTIFVAR